MHILNVGTRTSNWWLANGPGCSPTYNFSAIDPISFKPQIVRVEKCLLDYQYVEVAHSSMQMLLSVNFRDNYDNLLIYFLIFRRKRHIHAESAIISEQIFERRGKNFSAVKKIGFQ